MIREITKNEFDELEGKVWNELFQTEHGLEITINGDQILYVGPYEGVPPFDKERIEAMGFFDEESDFCSNYADQE